MSTTHWFQRIREGDFASLSKLIRYGDPLFLFFETVDSRIRRGDNFIVGALSFEDLNESVIWKCIRAYRTLTLHSALFTTQNEIRMAACNIYHVLRLFGITLERKREFYDIMGDQFVDIYYSEESFVQLDADGAFTRHDSTELVREYQNYQTGTDLRSYQMRILLRLLGHLTFKCVSHRDGTWTRQLREFQSFDLHNIPTNLPPYVHIERLELV